MLHVHIEHIAPSFLIRELIHMSRDLDLKLVDVKNHLMEMNGQRVDSQESFSELLDLQSINVMTVTQQQGVTFHFM